MRGWITAGLMLIGSCTSSPSVTKYKDSIEKRIDQYSKGLELQRKAEVLHYTDEKRAELYQSALEAFKSAENQKGREYESIVQQAHCLAQLWKNDEALQRVNKAIEQKGSSNAYRVRGLVQYNLRAYDKSLDDCTKALELESNNAEALWTRATAYLRSSEGKQELLKKSEADVRKYIELRPEEADGYLLLSNIKKIMHFREEKKDAKAAILEEYYQALGKAISITNSGKQLRHAQLGKGIPERTKEQYEKYKAETK